MWFNRVKKKIITFVGHGEEVKTTIPEENLFFSLCIISGRMQNMFEIPLKNKLDSLSVREKRIWKQEKKLYNLLNYTC